MEGEDGGEKTDKDKDEKCYSQCKAGKTDTFFPERP